MMVLVRNSSIYMLSKVIIPSSHIADKGKMTTVLQSVYIITMQIQCICSYYIVFSYCVDIQVEIENFLQKVTQNLDRQPFSNFSPLLPFYEQTLNHNIPLLSFPPPCKSIKLSARHTVQFRDPIYPEKTWRVRTSIFLV